MAAKTHKTSGKIAGSESPTTDMAVLGKPREFVTATLAIVQLEAHKLRHDPTELISRAIQPMLWLPIFGNVFSKLRGVPTGGIPYLDFMAPGILSQSVLFMAIFYGIFPFGNGTPESSSVSW